MKEHAARVIKFALQYEKPKGMDHGLKIVQGQPVNEGLS